MTTSPIDRILNRVRRPGVLRPRDLEGSGIPGTYLARLARRGLLARIGCGLYTLPGAPAGEHHSLAEAAASAGAESAFHDLRHTRASLLLARGSTPRW
jgi:integrase